MSQAPAAVFKIPTKSPQPAPGKAAKLSGRGKKTLSTGRSPVLASGNGRAATRGGGEVIELECGITVYPARSGGGRWRAVWYEAGERQQCEAATEERLAARLEKVKTRLEADAPDMNKPGAALIAHYLDPDRLPVQERWSRKHAHTQRRLCQLPCMDLGVLGIGWRCFGWRGLRPRRLAGGASGPVRGRVSPAGGLLRGGRRRAGARCCGRRGW
jgi:hypothetical protein